jgi:protein-S-isoprenylcysteine O-methyltransferase
MTGWRQYLFYAVTFGYLFFDFYILRTKAAGGEKVSRDKFTSIFSYLVIGVAFVLTFNFFGRGFLLPAYGAAIKIVLSLAGLVVAIVAMGFRYAAKKELGKYFTVKLNIFADHKLVTTGLYRRIRHPAYLGLLLWLLSVPLLLAYPFGLVTFFLPPALFFIVRIFIEERTLLEKFGAEYRQYQNSSYRLLPHIW